MGRTVVVRTRVDHKAISALIENPASEPRRWFEKKVALTVAEARKEAPVRTGALVASIGSTYHGRGRWTVYADKKYARFVHEGTKGPYPIRPRPPKKALAWEQDGRVVVVREVMHPGIQKPNPFLVTALERVWKS